MLRLRERLHAFIHPDRHLARAIEAEGLVRRLRSKQRPQGVVVHAGDESHEYATSTHWFARDPDAEGNAWLEVYRLGADDAWTRFATYPPRTWLRVEAGLLTDDE